jgi:hypothetical protein
MIAETAVFTCSICGEPSSDICVYCTKDACGNHRCDRCKRCSDCCECDVPLSAEEAHATVEAAHVEEPAPVASPEPAVEEPPLAEPSDIYSDIFAPEQPPKEPYRPPE